MPREVQGGVDSVRHLHHVVQKQESPEPRLPTRRAAVSGLTPLDLCRSSSPEAAWSVEGATDCGLQSAHQPSGLVFTASSGPRCLSKSFALKFNPKVTVSLDLADA